MAKEDTSTIKERLDALWKRVSVNLSGKDRMTFVKYLSVLLGAGMPIDDAVSVLYKQASGSLKIILGTLRDSLRQGSTISDGLRAYPHVFDPIFLNLISAGETSGTLQTNLEHLSNQMEKEYELRKQVQSAMIYPVIVVGSAILISIGVVMFVLPNVTEIFESLDVTLPLPTRILLGIADFTANHGFVSLLILIGAIIATPIIWNIPFLKPFFHRVLLAVPIVGPIVRKTNLARITRLMGIMIQSGMSIDEAIPLTRQVVGHIGYKRILSELENEVAQGNSITSVFRAHPKLVPPMVMQVIYAGEQAGTLDDMLNYIAAFYEREIDDTMENLSALLEPIMLIFIGVLIGGLALSILMPIYKVVGSF